MDTTNADDNRPEKAESAMRRDDQQRALDHKLDRLAPSRRAVWPKDDRRSSERMARSRKPRPTDGQSGDPPAEGSPP
jgi:hypothetical protein